MTYIGYEYVKWKKTTNTETTNLKALINKNIINYTSIIELLEKQINSKKAVDLNLLDVQRYNALFSFDKDYIPLSNMHFVLQSKNQNKISYNQQGKETFVILPNNEFLYSITDSKNPTYLVESQHDLIFIIKALKHSEKTIFLVLKVELNKFITTLVNKLNLNGSITLINDTLSREALANKMDIVSSNRISSQGSSKASNDNLMVLNDLLPFGYKSLDYFDQLYRNVTQNNIIGFLLLSLSINSIIYMWQIRNFCNKLVYSFATRINEIQSANKILQATEKSLTKHQNNIEQAFSQTIRIYNGFISSLDEETLTHLELNDFNYINTKSFTMDSIKEANKKHEEACNERVHTNLIELLDKCKTVLYQDFYLNQVQCKIKSSYNKNIQLANPWILFILAINYTKQAIERTPANNSIMINVSEEENYLTIRIEDTCFSFGRRDINGFNLFELSEETLQSLAEYSSIQISTISDNKQNHITELKIKINQNDNSRRFTIKQVDNVLYVSKGN